MQGWGVEDAFVVFDQQDSGCTSWGVERDGDRWFVKTATTAVARTSLTRAVALHSAVRHEVLVGPAHVFDGLDGITLVYPWRPGRVLNQSTTSGSDRSGLESFQRLPLAQVAGAVDQVLDAHLAIAAAGWVAGDLYDGCFLYDEPTARMSLVDLDEYRPRPFLLHGDRAPGSTRYMAPEEFRRGALIDHRTTVFALGRTALHLLTGPDGWRGTPEQQQVVARATAPEPDERYQSVRDFVAAWRAVSSR